MPRHRKPDEEVSPAALRMRKMREVRRREETAKQAYVEELVRSHNETKNLVRVDLWVPKDEAKLAQTWAANRRAKARIPESEVPP